MKDKIQKEVTKSGNSGHVIVPKDWVGSDVTVVKNDNEFTEEDARKCVGHLYELILIQGEGDFDTSVDTDYSVPEILDLMGKQNSLKYEFNAEPLETLNRRVVGGREEYRKKALDLIETERQKESSNEYKIATYRFVENVTKRKMLHFSLEEFYEDLEDI